MQRRFIAVALVAAAAFLALPSATAWAPSLAAEPAGPTTDTVGYVCVEELRRCVRVPDQGDVERVVVAALAEAEAITRDPEGYAADQAATAERVVETYSENPEILCRAAYSRLVRTVPADLRDEVREADAQCRALLAA